MDNEDDIPVKNNDNPADDPQEDGMGPFASNQDPLEIESQEESDLSEEADQIRKELEGAKEEVETDESPQPDMSEGGDPDPFETTQAEGDSLPKIATDEPPTNGPEPAPDAAPADLPTEQTDVEAPAPDVEELDETQNALEAFGQQLDAFNAAGGAGGVGDVGGFTNQEGPDVGGGEDGMRQFAEANTQLHNTHYEFLKDHARALSDIQRRLEIERL